MFSYDVKFITTDESLQLDSNDFRTFKYETKKKSEETIYDKAKRDYYEQRGGHWRAPKPRQIRQLESKLRDKNILTCKWTCDTFVTLVFSSGVVAYLTIKPDTLDVMEVLFDKFCVGKISNQAISDVVLSNSHLLFIHMDRSATLITLRKSAPDGVPCRLSVRDPHVQILELNGSPRRIEKKVSWTETEDIVRVVVWSATATEPAPWSPIIEDHANLHLYEIKGQQMSLIGYHQLEHEVVLVELSSDDNNVHIVEQINDHKGAGVVIEWRWYGAGGRCGGVCRAASPARVRAARLAGRGARLAAACGDGALRALHRRDGHTHTATLAPNKITTDVRWAGDVIVTCDEGGRLQCFDHALALLLHRDTKCIDLMTHFPERRPMQILGSRRYECGPLILLCFPGGPLTLLHIQHPRLLTAWINSGRISNAVSLLCTLDWEHDADECIWGINKIICEVLDRGHSSEEWAAQAVLEAFLPPQSHQLPQSPHTPLLHDLARKFIYHLLRVGRVEAALGLGSRVRAWDVLADVRWAAERAARPELAARAARAAQRAHADTTTQHTHTESECSESCSQCTSHSSCSRCEGETSSCSEEGRPEPPPLPTLPPSQAKLPPSQAKLPPGQPTLPPGQPTVMAVPITKPEPASTNSIRPNLHQYLERDNTIWTTDVKDDSCLDNGHGSDLKPTLSQNSKWLSVDNVLLNYKQPMATHNSVNVVNDAQRKTSQDLGDMPQMFRDKLSTNHRRAFHTELRPVRTRLYQYHDTHYSYQDNYPSSSYTSVYPSLNINNVHQNNNIINGEYNLDNTSKPQVEKNKVKFSNTVTIAVLSSEGAVESPGPEPGRELADSLPLCAPHNYLAAFRPQRVPPPEPPAGPRPVPPAGPRPVPPAGPPAAAPPGTPLDYVEV